MNYLLRVFLLCLTLVSANDGYSAGTLRVASWNMKWFPSGTTTALPTETEAARIRDAGAVLAHVDADVIVLQEIRDLNTAEALAKACGPAYAPVIVSSFREGFGGSIGWQQLVIISRLPAKMAWAEDWKTVGVTDPPRGFVFACFKTPDSTVGVYGVHLKSNLKSEDPRTNQLNILKRELAMKQLLEHRTAVSTRIGESLDVCVVAGDFNTSLTDVRFASESTIRSLLTAGFSIEFASANPADRITVPAYRQYPATTFDYIIQLGGKWSTGMATVQVDLSDHRLVHATLSL